MKLRNAKDVPRTAGNSPSELPATRLPAQAPAVRPERGVQRASASSQRFSLDVADTGSAGLTGTPGNNLPPPNVGSESGDLEILEREQEEEVADAEEKVADAEEEEKSVHLSQADIDDINEEIGALKEALELARAEANKWRQNFRSAQLDNRDAHELRRQVVTIADQTKTPELAGVSRRQVERFKDEVDVYRQKMLIIGQLPEPLKRLIPVKLLKRIAQIHLEKEETIESISNEDLEEWIRRRLGDLDETWSAEKLDEYFMAARIVMNVGIQDAIDRVDAYITKVNDLDSIYGIRRYFKRTKQLRKMWRKRLVQGVYPLRLREFLKGELDKMPEADALSEHTFWQTLKKSAKTCDYFTRPAPHKVVNVKKMPDADGLPARLTHRARVPSVKPGAYAGGKRGDKEKRRDKRKQPERCWIKGCRAIHLIKDHPGATPEQIQEALSRRKAHIDKKQRRA